MWAGELSLQRLQGLRQEGQQEVVLSHEEKLKQLAKAKQKKKKPRTWCCSETPATALLQPLRKFLVVFSEQGQSPSSAERLCLLVILLSKVLNKYLTNTTTVNW